MIVGLKTALNNFNCRDYKFLKRTGLVFYGLMLLQVNAMAQAFLSCPIEGHYGKDFIIVNYVDWGLENQVLDHQCGNKAYNGHQGTDFVIRSFAMIDSGINVLAAADGVVTGIQDGLFDREKQSDTAKGLGNYIALKHTNGYYSYYAHLASQSIKVKVGDTVSANQKMALVGSSGNSSDPHLHFELWWDSLILVDPFSGACGNGSSLWLNPIPYDTSFAIWTSGLTNFIPDLDTLREEPIKLYQFKTADEAITYWSILYGLRKGDTLTINWYDPDDTLYFTYSYEVLDDTWYFYYWSYINPPTLNKNGNWSARFYRNKQLQDELKFTVDIAASIQKRQTDNLFTIYPNPVFSSATITWKSELKQTTRLLVLDAFGRKVKTLVDEDRSDGVHSVLFESQGLASGTYIIQLRLGQKLVSREILLLK